MLSAVKRLNLASVLCHKTTRTP